MCSAVFVSVEAEFEAAMYRILPRGYKMHRRRIKDYTVGIPTRNFSYKDTSALRRRDSQDDLSIGTPNSHR